ncbi:hypothetical protein BOX37_13990 [Nocardia mangyaensis]|uniref:UspA domain-containing protein n=1 Tax=Nocardia mangyaensis TaxID=2213200 RepID=A0A1J0VS57_9NOCA|nr:universal stress protein [Nocardia mangyaensis]APE34875.1 hypothetical protein BOX37_13990 [Nocardia mangyaensis]
MTQHSESPHQSASAAVVVGADGSDGSNTAVRWAARTAADRGRALHIVHCTEPIADRTPIGPSSSRAGPIPTAATARWWSVSTAVASASPRSGRRSPKPRFAAPN